MDWFSMVRLKSHKVQMLKKDAIASKESTQSVRERNRSLEQFKENSRGRRRSKNWHVRKGDEGDVGAARPRVDHQIIMMGGADCPMVDRHDGMMVGSDRLVADHNGGMMVGAGCSMADLQA